MPKCKAFLRLVTAACAGALAVLCWQASAAAEQIERTEAPAAAAAAHQGTHVHYARTDSPRQTLASFKRLRDEMEEATLTYQETGNLRDILHMRMIGLGLHALLDPSEISPSKRDEVTRDTMLHLLDIFDRVALPPLEEVPDASAFAPDAAAVYTVPQTPIRIVRLQEGARAGEFLFDRHTIMVAPRFAEAIAHLPSRLRLESRNWSDAQAQLTGPLVPPGIVSAIPTTLKGLWLGTPVWKLMASFVLVFALLVGFWRLRQWVESKNAKSRLGTLLWKSVPPVSMFVLLLVLQHIVLQQFLLWGDAAAIANAVIVSLLHVAAAWIFWIASRMAFEWIILSPRIKEGSLDANMLRLLSALIGFFGAVVILALAAHGLGLPVVSLVAGLGVGGLAVALAIRPTLENLIGGIILYMDKPVRVGDFCSFGNDMGVVERIGVRSTEIRATNRTLVSIPNAQFADMKLVNWSNIKVVLIEATIRLRMETTSDQIRFLLTKLRVMAYAHPRIEDESVRIRYVGPTVSSRDIGVRVFAKTSRQSEYYAICEDFFLRVDGIVEEAGTAYAVPARTLYLGRDQGIDKTQQRAAEDQVQDWRRHGKLPFPHLPAAEIERLSGTLDYPPAGSLEDGDIEEPADRPKSG